MVLGSSRYSSRAGSGAAIVKLEYSKMGRRRLEGDVEERPSAFDIVYIQCELRLCLSLWFVALASSTDRWPP